MLMCFFVFFCVCFFFQAEDGIRDLVRSRGLGDVYKRQVYVYTLGGDTVPTSPVVTQAEIGMTLIASVRDNISGNSCWTYITVQDKMRPTLVCEDMTISCLDLLNYDGPVASDNCDGDPDLILVNEVAELLCDPNYIKQITRTYIALSLIHISEPTRPY